jgi:hypothetical protein
MAKFPSKRSHSLTHIVDNCWQRSEQISALQDAPDRVKGSQHGTPKPLWAPAISSSAPTKSLTSAALAGVICPSEPPFKPLLPVVPFVVAAVVFQSTLHFFLPRVNVTPRIGSWDLLVANTRSGTGQDPRTVEPGPQRHV